MKDSQRLIFWVLNGLLSVALIGGGAWAANMDGRVARVEDQIANVVPVLYEIRGELSGIRRLLERSD